MKKFLAMFLALLMLALPAFSLAEGDFISEAVENGRMVERSTTFTLSSTGDETVDQILGELLNALSVVTYWQEGDAPQGGLHLNMNGTDILSVDFAAANEMLYLKSDLLAGDTVVFANGDEQGITENILGTLVAMGIMSEEDANEARAQMTTALSGAQNPMADVDVEAILAGFDFSALEAFGEDFAAKVTEGDLSGLPEGSDPAIMAVTMTLTAEDIVKVYDILFDAMRGNPAFLEMLNTMVVSVNDQPMSAEDAIDEMKNQVDTQLPGMIEGEIPFTLYLNGDDEVVAAVIDFTMKATAEEGSEPEAIKVDFDYWRHTAEDQVNHAVVYTLAGESVTAKATADIVTKADDVKSVVVTIQDTDTTVSVSCEVEKQATETEAQSSTLVTVNVDEGGEVTTVTVLVQVNAKKNGNDAEQTTVATLSVNGAEVATMTTQSKTADPAASIVTADAIRLAQLSQEDFQNWAMGVVNNLQLWLVTALQALPTSVLMTLMQ